MGDGDKAADKLDEFKGKAKEVEGNASGDDARAAQGQSEQTKANVKQAGEKLKDAFGGD
jgi:uncharacterized protein YjbJ (UPF0337 family)